MKKFSKILIIAAFLGLAAYAGQDIIINTAQLDGFMYGNKSGGIDTLIVPDADSLGQYKFQNVKNPSDPLDAVNFRTLLNSSSSGWDSIPFNPANGNQQAYLSGSVVYTTSFNDRWIELSDTTSLAITITQLADSIDALNARIESGLQSYKFTLPSAGTLSQSIALSTDIPIGWVLNDSGFDLEINHGLGKSSSMVSVKYYDLGYKYWRPFGDAYSGLTDVDNNNLTIVSLNQSYKTSDMQIKIIF